MEVNTNEAEGTVDEQVMQNPQALAALLDRLEVTPRSIKNSFPPSVKRRINALKNLQVNGYRIQAKFHEEVHKLERKYADLYKPLLQRRKEIVTGAVEPTDAECEWHSDCEWQSDEEWESDEELADQLQKNVSLSEKEEKAEGPTEVVPKGIPEFWLTVLRSVDLVDEMIEVHDEPILKHLQDIKLVFSGPDEPMGFTLEFHFEPNSFFENSVLTKMYKMRSEPDPEDLFYFEGPEIIACEGCNIDWYDEKDVTIKTVKKKQKHKGSGSLRTVTELMPNDSFFNFFSPNTASSDESEGESEFILAADFEIGQLFRELIVPKAVLCFTGEALEDDSSEEEEEDEEELDEEQDQEDHLEDEGVEVIERF